MFFQLQRFSKKYAVHHEFVECIDELLSNDEVQLMANFPHHGQTTTLEHSLNVSYYTFLACRYLGLDARAGARAGLLHDLFLYDWHEKTDPKWYHTFNHPLYALDHAKKHFELSEKEEEMILLHMYPMVKGFRTPRYAETFVIALVDKFCAVTECAQIFPFIIERRFKKVVLGYAAVHGLIGHVNPGYIRS